jgi:EAL domain-containing protein (putative c-di-GMP-specific phosphodiesterase class I)
MIVMAETPREIGDLRFLVVEDHGFQRWVLGNILEGMGAKYVFSAGDGAAALQVLSQLDTPVDIIVSDLDMPGMDGMEFIRHIGGLGYPVSLILVSSLERSLIASVEAMARAYGVNLLGAIEKPPTATKLGNLVNLHQAPAGIKPAPIVHAFSATEIAEGLRLDQFDPFFQPKVDMKTRRIVGAEALARWRHPEKGTVQPEAFIAQMEQHGLIDDLTESILMRAALNCRLWQYAGLDVSVSVNLSIKCLEDVGLADRMTRLVVGQGLEPRHVTFEVTESAAMSDVGKTLEILSRLRMKGFGLSIDDYGTGYSSMQRLSRVPFTELKIEAIFVKDAPTQPSSRAMLESSLEMAQKLHIVAVAEGVESKVEWDLLRQLECPIAQGYFIAKPMNAAEFLNWARVPRQVNA